MKNISLLIVLALAVSLCNLSGKLKPGNSNAPDSGGAVAEHPEPTEAQRAALSGGSEINVDSSAEMDKSQRGVEDTCLALSGWFGCGHIKRKYLNHG